MLPFSVGTLMAIVGVVEIAVGVTILAFSPRLGGYVASAWLLLVAGNLALAGFFDVAVRDVVMSIAAFTLARGSEVPARASAPATRTGAVLASLVAVAVLHASAAPAMAQTPAHPASDTFAAVTLRQNMRKLWTDHVIWTRSYIVAAVGDQPDAPAAAARLLKNQDDIGAAVAGYYGKAAGDRLAALLKEHITIAVDVITFAKKGDKASQQQADAKWRRNGEDIADFLSKANPNWPRATLVAMMNKHLSTTTDEVVARLTKNWEADVRAFDAVYEHILTMADALDGRHSEARQGLKKQFMKEVKG